MREGTAVGLAALMATMVLAGCGTKVKHAVSTTTSSVVAPTTTTVASATTTTMAPASASPNGGVLAGTYALVVASGACGPGVQAHNDVMYVKGTSVTVTDPDGPLTGTLSTNGTSHHLMLVQQSNEIEDDLAITIGPGGSTFTAVGQLNFEASGGGGQFHPCPANFTGRRTSLSVPSPLPTSSATTPSTTSPTTTALASCPDSATLLTVWQASSESQVSPGITGFANISCWSKWVNAAGLGNGNGFIQFVTTPQLHVATPAEGDTFHSDVCNSPSSSASWKDDPDIAGC